MVEEAATAALVAPTRAADRRSGACRGLASQPGCKVGSCARSPTETEGGKLREEAGVVTHNAPRGLKTLPPGMRPEQLPEAPGPQRCDRTVHGTSMGAPLLAVQSLRGLGGVDDTAAKLLLQQALKMKKEEEEEERRLAVALEKEKLKVTMKRKEVEAVEESSGGSSAAPAAPAEPFMPRQGVRGRKERGVSLPSLWASTLQKLRILRSCSSSKVVDILPLRSA